MRPQQLYDLYDTASSSSACPLVRDTCGVLCESTAAVYLYIIVIPQVQLSNVLIPEIIPLCEKHTYTQHAFRAQGS